EDENDDTEEDGLSFVTINASEEEVSEGAIILPPHVELDYLAEYCKILRPIAVAIDRLQGQISCYYAILVGFEKRFSSYLELKTDVNEAILATVTHPFFKMRWLPPRLSGDRRRIHQLMLHSAGDLGLVAESEKTSSDLQDDEEDDFFVFSAEETQVQERQEITSHSKAELETLRFLEDTRKDLISLQ
ncbi:unnamed protein product, partial [Pleuronectes platessa]